VQGTSVRVTITCTDACLYNRAVFRALLSLGK
jgi:hypothetical protein